MDPPKPPKGPHKEGFPKKKGGQKDNPQGQLKTKRGKFKKNQEKLEKISRKIRGPPSLSKRLEIIKVKRRLN